MTTLGEQLRHDRRRGTQPLTADKLAQILNMDETFRKVGRPTKATQSWIAKIEAGLLASLGAPVRRSLAKAVGADEDLYLALPMQKSKVAGWSSLAKDLARALLDELPSAGLQAAFDTPRWGPLSAENEEALAILFLLVTSRKARLELFTNEPLEAGLPVKTLNAVGLLFVTAAILEADDHDVLTETLPVETVVGACRIARAASESRINDKPYPLRQEVIHFLREKIVLLVRDDGGATDRFAPMTTIYLDWEASAERAAGHRALLIDHRGHVSPLEEPWLERARTYFVDRVKWNVVSVRKFDIVAHLRSGHMGFQGIQWETAVGPELSGARTRRDGT